MKRFLLGLLLFLLMGAVSVHASAVNMDLSSAQLSGEAIYANGKITVSGITGEKVVAFGHSTLLLKKDVSTVWAWGYNSYGQLGNGTGSGGPTPVQVLGPGGLGYLTGVVALSAGELHSMALKSDGTVWAWGQNANGKLGDGTTSKRLTPVQVLGPGGLGYLTGVVALSAGELHSMALKSNGMVWTWGDNPNGQLGNGTETSSSTPVQVLGPGGSGYLTDVVAISGGHHHSVALKSDGTIWAWGGNSYGQLGNGIATNSSTPVQVLGPGGSGYLTGVVAISAGYNHSLALKNDGTIWAWGQNANGQLGNGTATNRSTPVQVLDPGGSGYLTDVLAISSGNYHSIALKSDGTIWVWGWNPYGQLGDGTETSSSTPVQVLGPGGSGYLTDVVAISGGHHHSVALKSDGTIWAWGYNVYGQLGDGTYTNRSTPVSPPPGKGYAVLSHAAPNVVGVSVSEANSTVNYLASVDGSVWRKWNGSSWQAVTLDSDAAGMNKSTLESLGYSAWDSLLGSSGTIYLAVVMRSDSPDAPELSAVELRSAEITGFSFQGDASKPFGETGSWSISATADYGALAYLITLPDGSEVAQSSCSYQFTSPGSFSVTGKAYIQELPRVYREETIHVSVAWPSPEILGIQCPSTLYQHQPGQCAVSASTPYGTLVYDFISAGAAVLKDGATATVKYPTTGEKSLEAKVSLREAPGVYASDSVSITVSPIEVNASLSCPGTVIKGAPFTCIAAAQSSWGTLAYEWSVNGGEVVSVDGASAQLNFTKGAAREVSVAAYVEEASGARAVAKASVNVLDFEAGVGLISGSTSLYKGQTETYSIGVTCPEGFEYQIVWSVDGTEVGTGNEVSVTFPEAGPSKVRATVSVADGGDLGSVISRDRLIYVSEIKKPFVSVSVPRLAEVGVPMTLSAKLSARYGEPVGYWTLPDGSRVEGTELLYTPDQPTDGLRFSYTAYVDGYPDTEVTVQSNLVKVDTYELPDFKIRTYVRVLEGYAPYSMVFGVTGDMRKVINYGVNLTHRWDFGDGTVVEGEKPKIISHVYSEPGTYTVTLSASDDRGNSANDSLTLTVLEVPEITVDSPKIYSSNRYNRAPLRISARPVVKGGHPKLDRISSYQWTINGEPLTTSRFFSVVLAEPGDYTLGLTVTAASGKTATGERLITVNPNQLPQCTISYIDYPKYKYTKISASCSDPDGRVLEYAWDLGDGTASKGSRVFARYQESGTYQVTLTVRDDAGAEAVFTESITVQR